MHRGLLAFCGSSQENLVVGRCVVVQRGSLKFSGSEHENFFIVVGRAVVVQRGLLKLLGSSHENAGVVSIRRGRIVVGFGHRGSEGLAAQFGLHRRSFSDPGSSQENAGVVSGGKYVAGSFVGRALIRETIVVATGCSARVLGPRVRAGRVLSVCTASSATRTVTGGRVSLGSGRVGRVRILVVAGASVSWLRIGDRLGPLVRRMLRVVAALVIGEVISAGLAVVDFCFFGPSIN